jgi:hypothetical protein
VLAPELAGAFDRQLEDERAHMRFIDDLLGPPVTEDRPLRHAALFGKIVAGLGRDVDGAYLACVATMLCTAIESVAFGLLAGSATDSPSGTAFRHLHEDEATHFSQTTEVAARLATGRSMITALRAMRLVAALSAVALFVWWPRFVTTYRRAGLPIGRFVEQLSHKLARAMAALSLWFPRRTFNLVTTVWLRLCDGFVRLGGDRDG